MHYTWKNLKKSCKVNKFKISSPTWNENFDLPDESYPDIQDYSVYILKRHWGRTGNPSITIYINKIENILEFKIKTGYYLKLLIPETNKLFRITWKILEVVLVHCNIINNNYQQDSRALYTFIPNKSSGQLWDISNKSFIFFKTVNSEFSYI